MQLVPAVTELIVAELLYLQYKDRQKPIFLYINSTGTTRADGETVSGILCKDNASVQAFDLWHVAAGLFLQNVTPLTCACRLALRQKEQQYTTQCNLLRMRSAHLYSALCLCGL